MSWYYCNKCIRLYEGRDDGTDVVHPPCNYAAVAVDAREKELEARLRTVEQLRDEYLAIQRALNLQLKAVDDAIGHVMGEDVWWGAPTTIRLIGARLRAAEEALANARSVNEQMVTRAVYEGVLAERDKALDLLKALVNRLKFVHADSRYLSVWTCYAIHGGRYTEPTYTKEFEAAADWLSTIQAARAEEPAPALNEESLECECGWTGQESDCERVDKPEDDWWYRCPRCGEMTAHVPMDELPEPTDA